MSSMIGELEIQIEEEVTWDDVAPLARDLQDGGHAVFVSVRRGVGRPSAGGPGYDIVPILILFVVTTTFTSLVHEAVRDVLYPFLKEKLYALYSRLPGMTRAGPVKPLAITMEDGNLEALYRFPEGLTQELFEKAFRTIPEHFEALRDRGSAVVMLDYDTDPGTWVENTEAGEFLTWARQQRETPPTTSPNS
jgi:hypothetical protein